MREERTFGLAGALHLPERIAAMAHGFHLIQRADVGKQRDFLAVQRGHAQSDIIGRTEQAAKLGGGDEGFADMLAQAAHVAEAEAHRQHAVGFALQCAGPRGPLHIDGTHAQAVALCIFHQHGRRVETHRLVIEDGGGECSEVLHLEICRGIGDERKAGSVRFGESVKREGADGLDDFVLRARREAVGGHAAPQLAFEILHALPGAAHAHGAAQLFSLRSAEVGNGHGHAQQLLLKKRYAESTLEYWFERRMRIGDRFLFLAAAHVRMHHFADDGTGTNDGYLHDKIVKIFRAITRQRGHLRTAFDLEHADRVCALDYFVDFGVFGQLREVNRVAVVLRDEGEAILEYGHHAEAEQIDLDDSKVGAVFLVPLHDSAAGHGGAFQRDYIVELALADNHAAGVLAEVARQVLQAHAQL